MGLIDRIFGMVFGSGNNLIRDTAEVFVENAEKGAAREAVMRGDALAQFAGEFSPACCVGHRLAHHRLPFHAVTATRCISA